MDDGVLVEAVLPPAFPLTIPAVNGHKLHLCLCERERERRAGLNKQNYFRSKKTGYAALSFSVMCVVRNRKTQTLSSQ